MFASELALILAALIQATRLVRCQPKLFVWWLIVVIPGPSNFAETAGIPVLRIAYKDYATRELAEDAMLTVLAADGVVGILLAGYMRI